MLAECLKLSYVVLLSTEITSDVLGGLDSFMARNVSEDDASFAQMMKDNEERHKQKHAWLHEQELEQLKVSAKSHIIQDSQRNFFKVKFRPNMY